MLVVVPSRRQLHLNVETGGKTALHRSCLKASHGDSSINKLALDGSKYCPEAVTLLLRNSFTVKRLENHFKGKNVDAMGWV